MKTILLVITSLTLSLTGFYETNSATLDEAGYSLVEILAANNALSQQLNDEFGQTVITSIVQKSDAYFLKVQTPDHQQQTLIFVTHEQVASKKIPYCKCLINNRFRNFGDPMWYKCGVCIDGPF